MTFKNPHPNSLTFENSHSNSSLPVPYEQIQIQSNPNSTLQGWKVHLHCA